MCCGCVALVAVESGNALVVLWGITIVSTSISLTRSLLLLPTEVWLIKRKIRYNCVLSRYSPQLTKNVTRHLQRATILHERL